jgi:hypothetical protein
MWQSSGHLVPSETQLRYTVKSIVDSLITNGIKRDKACFQLDNEPAKYSVPMGLYCVWANIIHDELLGNYDLYVGADEVSYRDWYNNIIPNCNCEGIAFHLQNCALNTISTDASINFIKNLATQYGKKITCSEGNYLDPSLEYSYNMIKYHIQKCKEIGALDYCVIFLALANQDKYKWLSFVYNNVVRSEYYDDYMQLIENEKEELLMEYLRPLAQQAFYNAMGWGGKPYHNNTPSLPIAGRKVETNPITWADLDAVFETLTKGLVKSLMDNGALPAEFPKPMDIKYFADGTYNNNWRTIANSNPEGS